MGFDNAHAINMGSGPGRRVSKTHDHLHRFRTVKAYDYRNAAELLQDFWAVVDGVLRELGVI